jgi:hypothetical protein
MAMTPEQFTTTFGPLADDISAATGLHPSVVLGQAAQETGWGNHYVGNNLFGISPSGPQGQYVAEYPSVQHAAQAYVDLINGRYKTASNSPDPATQARTIGDLGYGPNKAYGGVVAERAAKVQEIRTAQSAPSADDLLSQMKALTPQAAPAPTTAPSADDLLSQMKELAPGGQAPAATETTQDSTSVGGLRRGSMLPSFIRPTGGPVAPSPGLPDEMPTLAGNLPSATPGVPAPPGPDISTTIRNALAPAPNTTYGSVLPLARDNATNALRFAMPDMIRSPLIGLTQEGGQPTINPATNVLGITPEAASVAGFAASPLRMGASGAVPAALAAREAPLSQDFTAHPLNPVAAAKVAETPPGVPISVAAPAPANVNLPGEARSVGAAASRDMSAPGTFGMTQEQATAYRSTAEGQKLLEPQQPGIPDRNAYVPGVNPTAADLEQSVNTSRELKALKLTAPAVSEEARAAAAANNDARRLHFEQIAGSDVSTMNARAARSAQAETDLAATWAGKTDANAQPVIDAATEIKASPDGRRPLVRGALDAVTKELYGADGKLLTDPEQLYGVRKHIDDLMSREAAADDPKSVRASAALGQLKQSLDGVIEQSAPGFQQYLKNFSDASRPIDAMEVLQKHEPKLYDAQNRMQYSRVQSMMRQIVDARSSPGLNPYKSIPDETMQQLWALRDDLRRSAGAEELARTTGSDTAQNAWDMAKDLGKMGGAAALHAGANLVSPGFGSMAVQGAKNMLAPIFSARTARRQTARGMEMLHPPTNYLTPPP